MSVTYLPGAPQYGQGGGVDVNGLTQLAMAVKSFKMQEKELKRTQAQDKAKILMSNPALLVMSDPKEIEKALKEGYDLNFTSDQPANPADATGVPPPKQPQSGGGPAGGTGAPPTPPPVDPNAIAQIGKSVGGPKGGAQAANQPKAGSAPAGGGVTSAPMNVEQMAGQAHAAQTSKLSAMAPLYAGAVDQLTMEHMKSQTFSEVEGLKQRAVGGDFQAMGRLMMLSGKQLTDGDIRGMIVSSDMDPKIVSQALDFALGNETEGDKAKRFDSTLKTLTNNPDFMGRLVNPNDAITIARSVTYSGKLPEGIQQKPHSLTELSAEADYEKHLVTEVGLDGDFAHVIARMRTDGIPYTMTLPNGFHTITQRKSAVEERKAGADEVQAQAALLRAQADASKITAELSSKKYDLLNDRLRTMIEADKAKHPFPQEVQEGLINEVAHEVGLQPARVQSWYQGLTGGHSMSYTPIPDDELATSAAGGKPKVKAKPEGGLPENRKTANQDKKTNIPAEVSGFLKNPVGYLDAVRNARKSAKKPRTE